MSETLPPKNASELMAQWLTRLENHKKKIAAEEKITEIKLASNTTYYIQHTVESTLSSSDKRRHTLHQYKNFVNLIDHLIKEKNLNENVMHLLERAKINSNDERSHKKGHMNLNKINQLITDFHKEASQFFLVQKKSEPSQEIKR